MLRYIPNTLHSASASVNISVVCLDGRIDSSPTAIPSGSTNTNEQSSKDYPIVHSSEPKGSSISGMLLKEGKIIEEGQSTYWVKLPGTEPPSQVSKDKIPSELKEDWEAMKNALPPESIRQDEPGIVRTRQRAKDSLGELDQGMDTVARRRTRRKIKHATYQDSCDPNSQNEGLKPANLSVINSEDTTQHPAVDAPLQHSRRDGVPNKVMDAICLDDEDHEDDEYEGEILNQFSVDGKKYFEVAWANTIFRPAYAAQCVKAQHM